MIDTPLDRIRQMFAQANERVIIVTAFVGAEALDSLLESAKRVPVRSVYARWDLRDIASGASDWRSWDVARRHGAPMFACPKLHAKLYIADDKALLGSANATIPGLSGPPKGNLELLAFEDAGIEPVKQVLRHIQETSSPAGPMGPDVAVQGALASNVGHDAVLPAWMPKSNPDQFLRAMTGDIPHDDKSGQDRDALQLGEQVAGRAGIRRAAFDATVFRVVRTAFEGRVRPMGIPELRSLLSRQVSPAMEQLPIESMERLCQWLGEYGENTVMVPASATTSAQLMPGKLLRSERIRQGYAQS